MEITERPPMRFDLPRREEPGYIATQRWVLEVWEGEDPPGLAKIWARKPKFAVNGNRSCAELAIVHHLRYQGWHGVWVNSFGPGELRPEWFPAPAVKTLAETGAPDRVVEAFERLRAANGGALGGFFDVFAWREPGQVRFCEAKVGPDRIKATQIRFLEVALRFHRPADFMTIDVTGPSMPGVAGRKSKSAWRAWSRTGNRTAPHSASRTRPRSSSPANSSLTPRSHVSGARPVVMFRGPAIRLLPLPGSRRTSST